MPKRDSIQQMFDGIAPSYDRLNHLMSLGVDRRWRRKAVKEIVDGSSQQILDIACGTGDLTIDTAKASGNGSIVTGCDISEGMMSYVMAKAAKEGVTERIRLKVADGCNLPWEEGSFHRVTCAFGIRNFEDKAKGLEADRVFIACPDKLYNKRAMQIAWMAEQERNLVYVAYTRAKHYLGFIADFSA